jgi:hypothetical protein
MEDTKMDVKGSIHYLILPDKKIGKFFLIYLQNLIILSYRKELQGKGMKLLVRALTFLVIAFIGSVYADKPLKIYILVGQSNMQGTASIKTAIHMAADEKAKPLHDKLIDESGKPREFKDIQIVAFSQARGNSDKVKNGPLTFGYGKDLSTTDVCGPELAFGVTMHEIVNEPILIIKTSWGGKSLCVDFRPPSAGAYPLSEKDQKDQAKKEKMEKATGHYYRLMSKHVKSVLENPGKYHSAYKKSSGYELAGFVWFQGWNDMVNGGAYPNRYQPGGYDAYTKSLTHFIKDVRKEFEAPKMPFVIGVLGVGGSTKLYKSPRYKGVHQYYRDAMAAPAKSPEFKGNVKAVLTEEFWPHDVDLAEQKVRSFGKIVKEATKKEQEKNPKLTGKALRKWQMEYTEKLKKESLSPEEMIALKGRSNQGFHYLGCLKFFALAGEAFARAAASE